MTSMNPIAHKVASGSTSASAATGAQALQGSTSGVLSAGGGNFWDMILSRITAPDGQASAETVKTSKPPSPSSMSSSTAPNDNPLTMLQVALAAQSVDEQGNIVLTDNSISSEKLQGQLDFTNKIINHLKNMLPEGADKEGIFSQIISKLQSKSNTLQASLSTLENGVITKDTPVEDIPLPLLISLGLSPSEISEVTEKIQELEKKLGREITVEDLIAGVGGIITPPQNTTASIVAGNTIDENTQPTDELAAQLNAMDVGAGDEKDDGKGASLENGLARKKAGDETLIPAAKDSAMDTQAKKALTGFKENLTNTINNNKSQQGDMLFPITYSGAETDSAIFQSYGLQGANTLGFGSSAQAANMVSSPTIAGQAHPATQLVAATLIKQGKDGVDSTMTLRLDPPELGNVSIRLQFGKDKSVKAHLTIEKPETYMMLQREGHSLERALQHAGLDTNNSSISFELANQDNGAFGGSNNGEGGDNNFGGGATGQQDAASGENVLQSSVTWQVDPSTGQIRYNIFA